MNTKAVITIASLALLLGLVVGRLLYATDLAQCRNRVYAAELTQDASSKVMVACTDQQQALETCELGQRAAATIMSDLEGETRVLRAVLKKAKSTCSPVKKKP